MNKLPIRHCPHGYDEGPLDNYGQDAPPWYSSYCPYCTGEECSKCDGAPSGVCSFHSSNPAGDVLLEIKR